MGMVEETLVFKVLYYLTDNQQQQPGSEFTIVNHLLHCLQDNLRLNNPFTIFEANYRAACIFGVKKTLNILWHFELQAQ